MYEDEPTNEYRIKVTVRNNLILSAIENAGHKSVAAFCRSAGIHVSALTEMIAMRKPPINSSGEFSHLAKVLMEELCALPTELWTSEQLTLRLTRNSAERDVSSEGMRAALGTHAEEMLELMRPSDPEEVIHQEDIKTQVIGALDTLRPREAMVLRMRFGIGCEEHTLEEVGKKLDVHKERIRQIEAKALRHLKHPSRSDPLRSLLPNYQKQKKNYDSHPWECVHEFMERPDGSYLCPYCGMDKAVFVKAMWEQAKKEQEEETK